MKLPDPAAQFDIQSVPRDCQLDDVGVLTLIRQRLQFEASVIADYDAQSAVERELVLRLASLLWRLRRATTMETGLFEIQAEHLRHYRQNRQLLSDSRDVFHAVFRRSYSISADADSQDDMSNIEVPSSGMKVDAPAIEFARCFLRLANLPNFALDRLSRYEATLWRQAGRILFALEVLDRRRPEERGCRFRFGDRSGFTEKPV